MADRETERLELADVRLEVEPFPVELRGEDARRDARSFFDEAEHLHRPWSAG
jgi:hypothetical protein